jgi:hypothetical protein
VFGRCACEDAHELARERDHTAEVAVQRQQGPNHRAGDSELGDHARTLPIDSADGDERDPGGASAPGRSRKRVEPHHRLWFRLRAGTEHRAERDVVRAVGERGLEFREVVRGSTDLECGREAPHVGDRKIALTDVDPVGACEHGEIRTVVHEEQRPRRAAERCERPRKLERLPCTELFGAELEEGRPGGEHASGEFHGLESPRSDRTSVDDGIEPWRAHRPFLPSRAAPCYGPPRMQARLALVVISAPALAFFLHCAGKPKSTAESVAPASTPVTEAGSGEETGAGGAAGEEEEPPRPDPAIVKKVLDRTGESAPNEAETFGLRFEVAEMGPNSRWAMAVVNRGTEPVQVAFDPRLLVLEVEPPPDPKAKKWTPKPKTRICRLPDGLRPTRADKRFFVRLEPGRGMVEAFDPRLYCLPEKGVSPLVAGAKITARFGFAPKTKVTWKKGKREEVAVSPQVEPFVAEIAPPLAEEPEDGGIDDEHADAAEAGSDPQSEHEARVRARLEAEGAKDEEGVKELRGTLFELGADYTPPKSEAAPEPLALELRLGSDAFNETQATVTLALLNRSKKAQQVYFRREFVSFEVTGPDGVVTCDPQPDGRAPDRQAFSLLNAGGSLTTTSRLIELCPDDTFARPGLYIVNAQLDTFAKGEEFGYDAFVGKLVAERSVVIRIRSGSLPFPGIRTLEEVKVGATTP